MATIRLIALGALLAGCAAASPPPPSGESGEIAVALEVAPGTRLGSLAYQIDGNGFSRSGSIDVASSTAISARLGGIPVGLGYTLGLTASDGAGLTCAGTTTFDVAAGATTAVMIHLLCHEPARTGGVSVDGSVNVCPVLDGVDVLPAAVAVGESVALAATAHDSDGQPAALVLTWAASGGTLDATAGSAVRLTCTSPGAITVTVTASDGDCVEATTVQVVCSAPQFTVTTTPADLAPGQTATVTTTVPALAVTFNDGPAGFRSGRFSGQGLYTPAPCNALGGGDQTLRLTAQAAGSSATTTVTVHCPETYYTTKTPYAPMQDPATYSAAPVGFEPVFTELVARHGSRGLSSLKYDAAMLAIWQKAMADGAVTALGAQLGPDVQAIMKANALLGVGVAGISNPGYGNLTQVGIGEHQQLAARLLARLPGYFAAVGAEGLRQIVVINSGVDRAVDSSAFFARSLARHAPALQPLLSSPPAPLGYPAGAPVMQAAGSNRFLLYFHKLAARTDLVTDPLDPFFPVYQDSLAFQAYAGNADLGAKVASVLATPALGTASRAALEGLFTSDFVDKIAGGIYSFANTGTFTFASADGSFTTTLVGDGKTTVKSLPDAASMLYNLYVIGPAMAAEAGVDLARYLPAGPARELAYLQDAQDFYQMGPGIAESNPVTYQMAEGLEADFFAEVEAIAHGDRSHAAKLRFTHAEIIVPFAARLGLAETFAPVPLAETFTYETNPWRGQIVSPMAANVQWDVYSDGGNGLLVRMLYNEKEMDFKAACEGARFAPGSHFYVFRALAACYGH